MAIESTNKILLEKIREHPGITYSELGEIVGLAASTIRGYLQYPDVREKIRHENQYHRHKTKLYIKGE